MAVNEAEFRAVSSRWRAGELTATAAMQEIEYILPQGKRIEDKRGKKNV